MTDFTELGLAEPILRAIAAEGYTTPTKIQKEAIPAILSGQDVLGIAQTGTGKTAAFTLPLLHSFGQEQRKPSPKTCRALVLAPTRELATQIGESIRAYGRFVRISSTVIMGGVKPTPQEHALACGVDIVVATPGRLLDHLGTGALRLSETGIVVLDEADQMLDLGFIPAIRRIMGKLPARRQAILLSATMPKQIRALASDFLKDPREVSVAPAARPVNLVSQKVMLVNTASKRGVLVDILNGVGVGRTIVFTRTKRGADRVSAHLQAAGLSAAAIHGDKSQSQREKALAGFKGDRIKILVATDIAARGIDVDGVSHVINFELPNIPESYVHRIGRTARAGASGSAISLCDTAERGLLRDIENLIGRPLISRGDEPAAPPHGGRNGAKPQRAAGRGPGASGKPNRHGDPRRIQTPKLKSVPKADHRAGSGRAAEEPSEAGLERMLGGIGSRGQAGAATRAA